METQRKYIPSSWVYATLGEVCSHPQYGYTTKAADTGNLHLLRTTDITSGKIDWETVPYCSVNPEDKEKYLLEDDDIVVSRAGSIGVSYLIKDPKESVFASYLIRFKPFIDCRYFKYFLESPAYWNAISENQIGIAVPNVNANKLKSISIPIAPLKEQHRIVAKIEELFSELDKGVEVLKTVSEQLKVYRQSVLKNAFEGKLTAQWRVTHSAPEWPTSTLSKHLEFLTSGSRGWAQYYSKDGDVFIRAQNLKHDYLDLDDIAYVNLPQNSEGMRTRVQPGDVLITITGANVTKTGYVKADIGTAYVSQHVALARPARSILTEFLYWFLIAEAAGRKQLSTSAYGAGKPGLNLENIRSVQIDLPSLDEQVEIVSRINSMLSIEEAVAAQLEHEIGICDALRRSILKKAFSGQLIAQDSHDEHASVLLDRIKTKKTAPEKNNKKQDKRNAA